MKQRKKILIFAHAVTMAHFTRPLRLIEGLDPEVYDIFLASDPAFKKQCEGKPITFVGIKCLDPQRFAEIVGNAAPIYDAETMKAHVDEDLQVMDIVRPDLVIGDFRHSLTVSARIKGIKYINLTNAYWSPDTEVKFPLPEAPVVRTVGETIASIFIAPFAPIALKFNFFKMAFMLRREFRRAGLFIWDYRHVITGGDIAAYCDTKELVPLKLQSARERFVGPMIWSVDNPLPDWWSKLDPEKKRVFLTLGSSGPADSLPLIIAALAQFDIEVIVALAGKKLALPAYKNVHVTNYLPIKEACENSDLVICNGGSPVCHAALTYGIPTLGIVCNNDQLLNMAQIVERKAGKMLRYWNLTTEKITNAVIEMFDNADYAKNSKMIQKEFAAADAVQNLRGIIEELLGNESTAPTSGRHPSASERFDRL